MHGKGTTDDVKVKIYRGFGDELCRLSMRIHFNSWALGHYQNESKISLNGIPTGEFLGYVASIGCGFRIKPTIVGSFDLF